MGTILVTLLTDEPHEQLLKTATRHVSGTDGSVVVCRIIDQDQYNSEIQQNVRSGNEMNTIDEIEENATETATTVANEAFDGNDVTAHGRVGQIPADILEVADEYDCDHIFISGRKRSPVGKAIFGDTTQHVLLEFDGAVTVTTVND